MKYCPSCRETKSVECFSKNKTRYDGLQSNCKDCRSKARKEYYLVNKDRELALAADWSKKNKSPRKKYRDRYYNTAKGQTYYRKRNAKQRASKLSATPHWLTEDHLLQISHYYEHAKDCEAVSGEKYHVDHIIPLQGKGVCGLHVPWNLQILPAEVNLAKGNSY